LNEAVSAQWRASITFVHSFNKRRMAEQRITYDPRVSTYGVPNWQPVGPMLAT
jgi:hypothetical protein